ncbi:cell division protein ZapE [Nitratireductor sp. ZSWI3]|uniref:cell division protein ZapE n=1 Tax=Nitratireductor sp. ZSWI3 TaxID=2966359 RepID=UPI00214FE2B2|nr:cell division protein ZapE [Nitratireductor sp. ZSWI3]MCR4266563.1 cell division protein ZapE [Nitratireductor sp. ZSWI3]
MTLRDGLVTHPSVVQRYQHLVESGSLASDPVQMKVAATLDQLIGEICDKRLARKSSALGWLFAKRSRAHEAVRGLYIHGGVGRGKTMLMDLFYELVPAEHKRRAHFNDFMADAHDRIARHRAALKSGETRQSDPIPPVAAALAKEAWVLCFDEFTVTDIADAMILSRLFSALFERGVVLVATSNVAPEDLYRDGLNRGLFLSFIGILRQHTRVLELDAHTDYRMQKLNRIPVYLTPDDEAADRQMDEAWEAMADGRPAEARSLTVKGRKLVVPQAVDAAARFSFADLCERPLGARDYLALAAAFDTIFIDHVPVMDLRRRNEAKRFILLIDTLYDNRARLYLSAAAAPEALYTATTGTEAFEFERTVSRLIEMQSHDWLAQVRRKNGVEADAGMSVAARAG